MQRIPIHDQNITLLILRNILIIMFLWKCSFGYSNPMFVVKKLYAKCYVVFLSKTINSFCEFFDKKIKRFSSRNSIEDKYYNSISLYLYLLTSHRSTSAQESPSTPSVLQTAYAKGSTVSSVISEPILPPIPLTLTLLPLLH